MFKAKECVHIPQSISLHQEFYDPREFERFPMDHAYSQANYQGPGIGSQNLCLFRLVYYVLHNTLFASIYKHESSLSRMSIS